MNKGEGGQQPLLRNGWYMDRDTVVVQEMSYPREDPTTGTIIQVPKGIQRVLEERKLWPSGGMQLQCSKKRCGRCQDMLKCKACIKGMKCESCREPKVHSGDCTPKRACDNCHRRKDRCRCVVKQTCALTAKGRVQRLRGSASFMRYRKSVFPFYPDFSS